MLCHGPLNHITFIIYLVKRKQIFQFIFKYLHTINILFHAKKKLGVFFNLIGKRSYCLEFQIQYHFHTPSQFMKKSTNICSSTVFFACHSSCLLYVVIIFFFFFTKWSLCVCQHISRFSYETQGMFTSIRTYINYGGNNH